MLPDDEIKTLEWESCGWTLNIFEWSGQQNKNYCVYVV